MRRFLCLRCTHWASLLESLLDVIWCLTRHQLRSRWAGADIEARGKGGKTPLMFAADHNSNPEVIEALLKAGANAKAKDKKGKTALDHAKDNKEIYKTKAYWKLNETQYE